MLYHCKINSIFLCYFLKIPELCLGYVNVCRPLILADKLLYRHLPMTFRGIPVHNILNFCYNKLSKLEQPYNIPLSKVLKINSSPETELYGFLCILI